MSTPPLPQPAPESPRGPVRPPLTDLSGEHESAYSLRHWLGLVLGPLFLLLTLVIPPPEGLSVEGWRTAGAALLMATLWICESIPIPATALLPLPLFPLLGLVTIEGAAAPFAHPIIYLFLGGFIIALAMQRWGLHRRIAIGIISVMGSQPRRVVGGFLLASALISMWVSNTATALMMLPIALSVVQLLQGDGRDGAPRDAAAATFATALMLAVAYGATTGGMATLIGTPPNALLASHMEKAYGVEIGFGQWMCLGLPVTLVSLPIVYLVLTRISFRLGHGEVPGMRDLMVAERARMGGMNRGEIAVALVFALTAAAWICQSQLSKIIPAATDTVIGMTGALLLFLIPVSLRKGVFVMNWEATRGLPWEVLLLFGGGLSLAGMIKEHGLADYLGQVSGGLSQIPPVLVICIICFGILMLTELTSNTATAATFLPVVASMAIGLGQNPLLFVIPTALAANCSYMMPVGTPPNAIVFGSGRVSLPEMARAGIVLNIVLVPVIVGLAYLLAPVIFGVELGKLPAWAK